MAGAVRRWWTQPDHYYWLTAFLAARGAQSTLRRGIAAALASIAGLILLTIASPAGPQGVVARIIAVAVAVCSAGMAVGWMYRGWPSPRRSAMFVLASSVAIGALCLAQADPLAGLLASSGFAVLGAYAGFFHTPRILAVNVAAAGVTTGVLSWRLTEAGDVPMAVSAFGFLMIVNLATPTACQGLVQLLGIDVLNADIEPLTGLLNRQAFYRNTATFIATRGRADDRYLVLVLVSIDALDRYAESDGILAADRACVEVGQALRDTTRHDAVTGHLAGADFLVADSFAGPDATPLVERIRNAVAGTPARITASIGVVSTPMRGLAQYPPDDLLDELIPVAESAMREARVAGGDQVRHIVYPDIPTVSGEL